MLKVAWCSRKMLTAPTPQQAREPAGDRAGQRDAETATRSFASRPGWPDDGKLDIVADALCAKVAP
jgi:hypothetical protein